MPRIFPNRLKSRAERVFRVLGEAEAAVHGVDIEKVHFHEVGAVDSICDIVGICLALDLLAVEAIYCSPINTGSGTVNTEHGVLPVPAPATARFCKTNPSTPADPRSNSPPPPARPSWPPSPDPSFGAMPPMRVEAIGYGAGDNDFKEHANVVRVMIGEAS